MPAPTKPTIGFPAPDPGKGQSSTTGKLHLPVGCQKPQGLQNSQNRPLVSIRLYSKMFLSWNLHNKCPLAWLQHAVFFPFLLLATSISTCCSTREGVVSDTLVVLQLLPSLELYFSRKHSFASIRSIQFQDILFPYRRLNAF